MESHKLDLLDKIDLLIICPTRIRPEQAIAMYHTFQKTRTANSEICFYIADDDPQIEVYKQALRNCAYIIDKRRTIVQVSNFFSCELYPSKKYYGFIGDDNRYNTRGWDSLFIKDIEERGRGWGIAYGNDLLQKSRLAGNPVISGNIPRALGFMALPTLTHQFIDNFWTDIGMSINRLYYHDDVVLEHLHPFAKKAEMDDNYKWIYQSGVTEKDKIVYSQWMRNGFAQDRRKLARAMMADYRQQPGYKSIGLSMIVSDKEQPEVFRRCLGSIADYVDSINVVFNYKGFPKPWRVKKLVKVLEEFKDVKINWEYRKFTDFSQMRNASLKLNEEAWVFWTDADDVVPLPISLHDCIYAKPEADCFKCQVYSDTPTGGREIILQNRLFKNKRIACDK